MSALAKTTFFFGFYMIASGAAVMIFPNLMLKMFFLQETNEPWLRVAGFLEILLGNYYIQCSRVEQRHFILWTIPTRISVLFFFITLVLLGVTGPGVIFFGGMDFISALWTWYVYKKMG